MDPNPKAFAHDLGDQYSASEQFVTFWLGGSEMAVAIHRVRDIVRLPDRLTRPLHAPAAMLGAIKLRGQLIPTICLSKVFEIGKGPAGDRKILIVETAGDLAGLAIDRISGIKTVPDALQDKKPGDSQTGSDRYIAASASLEGREIAIIDVDALASDFGSGSQ